MNILLREAVAHLAEQLPHLISSLDSNDAYAVRRHARTFGHMHGKAVAAAEAARAHYTATARGVDHAVAALDGHWDDAGPAVKAAAEAELTTRRGDPLLSSDLQACTGLTFPGELHAKALY